MKKIIAWLLLGTLLLAWCSTEKANNISNIEQDNINEIIKTAIKAYESCEDNSVTFIDFAILWNSKKDNWNIEYYLIANGEWFKIDERWNLVDTCWFGGIPTTIELSKKWNGYTLINYQVAKDWNEYDNSTKEMFSKSAYKARKNGKYTFMNDKSLLKQAEEYFGVKIIPEWANNFECSFCDKLRYYNRTPEVDEKLNQTNDLYFDYVAEDNWKNTIFFSSDWDFEAKGSRDEWTWTRTFGQDENTIIVLNNNLDHVYDRYIITNQDENSLNTILEIIQRM